MKTTIITALHMLMVAPALAAGKTTDPEGVSILVILFLGLVALVILLQLVPAMVMLGSMLKGAFMKTPAQTGKKTEA